MSFKTVSYFQCSGESFAEGMRPPCSEKKKFPNTHASDLTEARELLQASVVLWSPNQRRVHLKSQSTAKLSGRYRGPFKQTKSNGGELELIWPKDGHWRSVRW